jgi:hypothetical protein
MTLASIMTPVQVSDLKKGDRVRAESTSRFIPQIGLEGMVVGSQNSDELRLDLDLWEPELSWLDARGYTFLREELSR